MKTEKTQLKDFFFFNPTTGNYDGTKWQCGQNGNSERHTLLIPETASRSASLTRSAVVSVSSHA